MKIFLSVFLAVIAIVMVSCMTNDTSITEVLVIKDITDRQLSQPNPDDIFKQFGLDDDQWNGAEFRFVDITDVSYNKAYEASIKPENVWLGNEFDRKKKVKNFKAEITQILSDSANEAIGKDNSSIYLPLARELNKLSQNSSHRKIVMIFSDLMENTAELSFYQENTLKQLEENPDTIRNFYETQLPLKNLNGIIIYLIYQPQDIRADQEYKIVSGFYKKLLETKGATVEIAANIN